MADQLNTQWTKIIGKTTYLGLIEELTNIASSISTASDGSSYVVGYTSKTSLSQNVAYITKYNNNGVVEWTKQLKLNNSYSTAAHSVSTAIDGSIYIVGSRNATSPAYKSGNKIHNDEAYVIKYNSDGSEVWTTLVAPPYLSYGDEKGNQAFSVSSSSDGSVYVVGTNKAGPFSTEKSFISKLNSYGSILWTKDLSPTYPEKRGQSVSASSDGSVYVVGIISDPYQYLKGNAFITKFNSDGSEAWSNLLGAATRYETYSVCTASDGSIYISGGATIYKYNSNGIKAWERSHGLGHVSSSVSITKDGSIYVAGTTIDPNYYNEQPVPKGGRIGAKDAFITKFYSDGSSERTLIFGTNKDDSVSSIIAALDGSIFTVGSTNANIEYWTTGYGKNELTPGFKMHMGGSYISKFNSNPYQGEIRTYTLNPSARTISEAGTIPYFPGSSAYKNAELTISGETTNVPEGTTIFYTLGGKGIDFSDFSQQWLGSDTNPISPLNTPFPLKINENGHFSFKLFLEGDGKKEGDETLEIKLFSDDLKSHQLGVTDTVLITDSYSRATGWSLGTSSKFIDEGDTFYTTFGAYNKLGTEFYYSLSGNGITVADFSTGGLTGSGTIANAFPMNGSFWFSHTVASDLTNEGTETIEIKIFSDAAHTKQVGTTATVSIADTSSALTYYSPNINKNLNTWSEYQVTNSVKAGDIVSQWFGTAPPATQQIQDISDTKLMDVVATTWADKVKINRVIKASDTGGKIEAKQIDFSTGEVAGSVISGGNGNDDIKGFAGWDFLDGGAGDDLIHGGNGRDILAGGTGRDELHGDFGWNTYRSEKDGVSDLIAIKSDQFLVNWLYGQAGNSPNGEKSDIIEGLDSIDKIKIIGVDTSEITFAANVNAKGVTGIGIYGKGILEALYTGGDLTLAQIQSMTSGDASAAAMSNSVNAYGVW